MPQVGETVTGTDLAAFGDSIKTSAGRWTFGGDVARAFDGHVAKRLKGVLEPFSTEANHDFLTRPGFKDIMCLQKYPSVEGGGPRVK